MARNLALSVLLATCISACADEPTDVSFKGHLVTVPAGWDTAREGNGPHQTLSLVPPEPTLACRLVVVRDSRRFGDTDARAFLATGRDRYGGEDESAREIGTVDGALTGYARTQVDLPREWGIAPRPGTPNLEVYAAGRGTELVGMMVGWYASDERFLDACRVALGSLRR